MKSLFSVAKHTISHQYRMLDTHKKKQISNAAFKYDIVAVTFIGGK